MFMKSFLLLIQKMLRLISIFKLEIMKVKLKKEELCLKYSPSRYQKLLRISEPSVRVKRAMDCIIRIMCSIEWSKGSWHKVEISRIKMELEVRAFMDTNSQMNKYGIHILTRECYLWQMQVLIQMDLNSLFVLVPHPILMKNILFLVELFRDIN